MLNPKSKALLNKLKNKIMEYSVYNCDNGFF